MWAAITSFLVRLKDGLTVKLPAGLSKMFSSSNEVSSSRVNQTVIVWNIVGMLWYSLIKWGYSDVWKFVSIALITNGLVAFSASKLKEPSNEP